MRVLCELPALAGAEARERILKSQTVIFMHRTRAGRVPNRGPRLTLSAACIYLPKLVFLA